MNTRKFNYSPGEKIGEAFYFKELPIVKKQRRAVFVCKCGNHFSADISNVKKGTIKGCGCWRIKHGHAAGRRGHTIISAEYSAWQNMINRCVDETNKSYKNYGGRGIIVCDRWIASFDNFILDVGNRPTLNHSLDRIDVRGNYEPSNCRWATRTQQARNRTDSRVLTLNGVTKSIHDWADETGLKQSAIFQRIKRGWTPERTLTTKSRMSCR